MICCPEHIKPMLKLKPAKKSLCLNFNRCALAAITKDRNKIIDVFLHTLANLYAPLWWIRHTEAGCYAKVVGYYA